MSFCDIPDAESRARGGIRTHKPFRTMDFESIAFAVSPPGPGARAYRHAHASSPPVRVGKCPPRRAVRVQEEEARRERGKPRSEVKRIAAGAGRTHSYAGFHVSRPGFTTPRHGSAVGRPPVLGARGGRVGGRGS